MKTEIENRIEISGKQRATSHLINRSRWRSRRFWLPARRLGGRIPAAGRLRFAKRTSRMGNILAGLGKPNRPNNNAGGQKHGFSAPLLVSHGFAIPEWLRAGLAAAGLFSAGGQKIGTHPGCRPPGRVSWARHESNCEMACSLSCHVNATLAQTDPSDPSETSDSSDSGHRAEPTGALAHEFNHPTIPAGRGSIAARPPRSLRAPVQNSVASSSPAFPAAAETTRRTTTCTCRRRGHGLLPNHRAALVPRAETSMVQTIPGLPADPRQPVTLCASLIRLLHPASSQSKGYEIPGAPVALCYAILRFISVNNAQLRISENARPFTQYDEIAPASFMLQSVRSPVLPMEAPAPRFCLLSFQPISNQKSKF
jgi:hypothetical protein